MRTFSIEERNNSPRVFIDESSNVVEISGNSTLTETNWFYSNLLRWIIALDNSSSPKKIITIRLKNVNISSSRWLTKLFRKVRQKFPSTLFEIIWYSEGNNRNASDLGRNMLNNTEFIVNFI